MTFSNDMFQELSVNANDGSMEKSPATCVYELLGATLTQAALEGRLTHGLGDCASVLRSDPSDVVLCILPWDLDTDGVNHKIQMLLVESLCLEYDILALKVDVSQMNSMKSLLAGKLLTQLDNSPELNCYLIKAGADGPSTCERKLMFTFRSPWSVDSVDNNNPKAYPD